ncbi:MAG: hypothetical protein GY786_14350 [Proteobacteria bacterium]|nr:hypothetical protein [Pseudomonadota bacterium]
MKIIISLLIAGLLLPLSSFAEERDCYPWKPRVLPYLKTQIQFYGIYNNSYEKGEITEETKNFNIDNLINNLKQSRSFVKQKRSCAPPKGIPELEKQAFLQRMDDIIQMMSEGKEVQSISQD